MLRYVGLFDVPPAYPTRVRTTPGILPNRESGPQNQPSANVAVSVFTGALKSISGISVFMLACDFAVAIVLPPFSNARIMNRGINNSTTILVSIVGPPCMHGVYFRKLRSLNYRISGFDREIARGDNCFCNIWIK